jgi:hypothetical protein
MKTVLQLAAASALATTIALCLAPPAGAQTAPAEILATLTAKSQISVTYDEPTTAELKPYYERIKARGVLQQLQQFLAPLRLPEGRKLNVHMSECGSLWKPYKSGQPVTICYEFVRLIEGALPSSDLGDVTGVGSLGPALVTREMALVGPFVEEALHDVALGVFDTLEIPVWGRAEDAADYAAAFVMLQFGTDVAYKTFLGTAYFLDVFDRYVKANQGFNVGYLGDIRPTLRQRYYNLLCIAYGGDPVHFAVFIPLARAGDDKSLPAGRALYNCQEDFKKLQNGFLQTVYPHVDQGLLKLTQSIKWLDEKASPDK